MLYRQMDLPLNAAFLPTLRIQLRIRRPSHYRSITIYNIERCYIDRRIYHLTPPSFRLAGFNTYRCISIVNCYMYYGDRNIILYNQALLSTT